jgi:hypothetical protein
MPLSLPPIMRLPSGLFLQAHSSKLAPEQLIFTTARSLTSPPTHRHEGSGTGGYAGPPRGPNAKPKSRSSPAGPRAVRGDGSKMETHRNGTPTDDGNQLRWRHCSGEWRG